MSEPEDQLPPIVHAVRAATDALLEVARREGWHGAAAIAVMVAGAKALLEVAGPEAAGDCMRAYSDVIAGKADAQVVERYDS